MTITIELIFIGNELLNGEITNTNGQWLCHKITQIGAKVNQIITIPDNIIIISKNIKEILSRKPNFLIILGGLGPTFDDMTLKGLEKALGEEYKLELNEKALKMIKKQYKLAEKLNIIKDGGLTEHRIKMASIPKNSVPLFNPIGTAPGVLLSLSNVELICLPGVPQEMKSIFLRSISSRIKKQVLKTGLSYSKTSFIVNNKVESEISSLVNQVMEEVQGIWIKTHPHLELGKAWVELYISCRDIKNKSTTKVNEAKRKLIKLIKKVDGIIKLID